jgi:hypothetical protein
MDACNHGPRRGSYDDGLVPENIPPVSHSEWRASGAEPLDVLAWAIMFEAVSKPIATNSTFTLRATGEIGRRNEP